jgi:adenosylcobinamide-GDP ribazoletransferase
MRFLRRIAMTVSYVTCFPAATPADEESLSGLAPYLPIAGLIVGFCLSVVLWALSQAHSDRLLSSGILTVLWLLLTNGLHFDGLMDTADGIFSHQSRERMLEIMLDPRVGNFGVLAGVSVLLLKFVALESLANQPILPVALLLIPAWARWAETFAIGVFPYAKPAGKGKIWHDSMNHPRDLFLAALVPSLAVAIACSLGCRQALSISAVTIFSGLAAAYWLDHKVGGHTGDTYGSVVELAEVGGLIAFALASPWL